MLKLYKIPGLFILCFEGKFGVGKTLSLVEQGLELAENYDLNIAANFPLNLDYCILFCRRKKFYNLANRLQTIHNTFQYLPRTKELLAAKESIILFDEVGIQLFSREFADSKRNSIIQDIFQCRKNGSIIFYSCQSSIQVDKQLRDRTDQFIRCTGYQQFDKKVKRSRLYSRHVIAFSRDNFEKLQQFARFKFIRPYFLAEWRFSYEHFRLSRFFRSFALVFEFLRSAGLPVFKKAWKFSCEYKIVCVWFFFFPSLLRNWKRFLDIGEVALTDTEVLFKCYDSYAKITKDDLSNTPKESNNVDNNLLYFPVEGDKGFNSSFEKGSLDI